MTRFVRLALAFSLFTTSVQFLAAQKPSQLRNFDIRDSSTAGAQSSSLTESSRRSASEQGAAIREKLLTTRGAEGEELRFSLNRFGLPKLVSARRGALTAPSAGDRARVSRDYLLANPAIFPFLPREIEELATGARHEARGLETVRLKQRIGSLPVYGGEIMIAFDRLGRIVQIGAGDVVSGVEADMTPTVSAEAAVLLAARFFGAEDGAQTGPAATPTEGWFGLINPLGGGDVAIQLTAFPMNFQTARPAWRMVIGTPQGEHEVVIAADNGEMLLRHSLVAHMGQALVWPQNPVKGERETKTFGDGWLAASATLSAGNNVDSFIDENDDGDPDDVDGGGLLGGRAMADDQDFTFPAGDGFGDPADFQASSVTHLFYHVNSAHDLFYELGFTEAAGNFQDDNFALGGAAGDAVVAKAQVLSSLNNASMSTGPDGIIPIMRSGVFVTPNDLRDSALEGDVIVHEYTHGVSNRLVGGADMAGCLGGPIAGAMGEGWSDYFALSLFDDSVSGVYLTGNPETGVRRFSYDGYPFSYENLGNEGFEVHNDGEIWAATLWDARQALGAEVMDQLVLDGLRLTPCDPTFIDARDAILNADDATNGGANAAALWEAFAARGLGEQARGSTEFPSFLFDANFDLPVEFQPGNRSPRVVSGVPDSPQLNDQVVYAILAEDPDGDTPSFEVLEGPPGTTVDEAGRVRWTAEFTSSRLSVAITDGNGGRTVHGLLLGSITLLEEDRPILISGEAGLTGLGVFFTDTTPLIQVTTRGDNGDPDLLLFHPDHGPIESNQLGANETITIVDPAAGGWNVFVDAFEDYSNTTLTFWTPAVIDTPLDTSRRSLAGVETSETFYSITVPPGTPNLTITTSGGSGDVDVILASGRIPTCQPSLLGGALAPPCDFDELSNEDGNDEVIHIENPAAGEYFIDLIGFGSYAGVTLSISSLPPGQEPVTELRAVTDGGAFADTVALGGIATAFGIGFTGQEASAGSLPLPTEMAGVRVLVNGVPAALFYVSPIQINFQIPYEITILGGTVEVVVERDGVATPGLNVSATADAPRFFRFDNTLGALDPVAINNNTSRPGLVSPGNPAAGGDILTLYLTGVSDLTNRPASGQGALGDPLSLVTGPVEATIGGSPATVEFAGLAPGFVGLVQINIRLPANLPPGTRLTLRITVNGASTQPAEISVVVP